MVTTDGFTVEPLEFPGGESARSRSMAWSTTWRWPAPIRSISPCPRSSRKAWTWRTRPLDHELREGARQNHVAVVAGDTKVVRRGEGSGLYLSVTGIGVKRAATRLA